MRRLASLLAATYLALAASAADDASAPPPRDAYVTVALSIQDLNGALALAGSIKKWEAARRRRVAISPDGGAAAAGAAERAVVALVPAGDTSTKAGQDNEMLAQMLAVAGYEVGRVEPVACAPNARPQAVAYCTALHAFGLAQYRSVLYLDPHAFVAAESATALFDRCDHLTSERPLAAAPDTVLPSLFSTKVLLLRPSAERHRALLKLARDGAVDSYDGGAQGFLNAVFPDWAEWAAPQRLSPRFNCADQIAVRSGNSFQHYEAEGDGVAILHLDYIRRGAAAQTSALTPYALEWKRLADEGLAAIEADPRHPKSKARKGG